MLPIIGRMDVVLVDRGRSLARSVRSALPAGDRLRLASEAQLAGGRWWPAAAGTRAILLAAEVLDAPALRALHRLWICEHGPPSYLLTPMRGADEAMLAALAGPPPHRAAGCAWRAVRGLSLVHLLALERLAVGA
ncbi:hypothetical protein HLB44_25810 [Aquincola sp. S2]|uniref:Uncharacterized protein n=1 Tax=Pseudaquabacterium terrae TaxID=2732868 RepID=A0ABX2EP15_9BURK|nr:hypothetical protein [Aquabacterium terrae]NRF70427.1 hypothetical protein [Aquabacterium terrae]